MSVQSYAVRWSQALFVAALFVCAVVPSPSSGQHDPYAYLLDTGVSSPAPWAAEVLEQRADWTTVPEDNVTHSFEGDAVLQNDKIAAVLRNKGCGVEVYSRTTGGPEHRATLIPCAPGGRATALSSVTIAENIPSAVMVDAALKTEGDETICVRYRLTTGQPCLEVSSGQGMARLAVEAGTRYAVVPEFFGDEMVLDAQTLAASDVRIPAESFLLHLIDAGRAIVACVWRPSEQFPRIVLAGDGSGRSIVRSEVPCATGETAWVVFMEGSSIWHACAIPRGGGDTVLDWMPPFPAEWRASFVGKDGVAESWSFGTEEGPSCPCWLNGERASVRPPQSILTSRMPPASLVVYPIDRSRATPLTALCLTDVMRNTLGVGPCQYLLDTEGLASQAPPTPDQVTRWVERQFRRKRAKRKAEQIAQRLEQMTEHVRRAQARMDQYAVLARKVRALCMSEEQRQPGSSAAVRELLSLTKHIERSIAATQETTKAPELAERLGGRIVALIGKENAFAECEKLGHQVRAVGGAQDKALSRCRMAVRRLKLACSTAQRPAAADLTTKVRGLADEVLARK